MNLKKLNLNAGLAASSWLLTLMIMVAELFTPFKDGLKATFGHHWIGKVVIITVVFFAVSYLVKAKVSDRHAWLSALGSTVVIFLFFVYEFMS